MTPVYSACLLSRRSVFDMFNFLASKHRQPPKYRPHEDDDEEGQLRTARSVAAHTKQNVTSFTILFCHNGLIYCKGASSRFSYMQWLQACLRGAATDCEIQKPQGHFQGNCWSLQVRSLTYNLLIVYQSFSLMMDW